MQQFVEQAILEGCRAACLVERAKVLHHVQFCRAHLDRLHRAKHLADKADHFPGRFATEPAVLLDSLHGQIRGDDDDREGEKDEQRDARVNAHHHHGGDDSEQPKPDQKRQPGQKVRDLVHVATKAADGLARRARHRPRTGAVQDALKEVLAQQSADRKDGGKVDRDVGKYGRRARHCRPHHQRA